MAARSPEDYVGYWLRLAHQRASADVVAQLKDTDVSPAQLTVLLRLRDVTSVSQNELGRLVAMEPANIHRIVRILLDEGLINSVRDISDGRRTIIRLSRKGLALLDKVGPLHDRAAEKTLSVLDPAEQKQLFELLKRVCHADPDNRSALRQG